MAGIFSRYSPQPVCRASLPEEDLMNPGAVGASPTVRAVVRTRRTVEP